MSVPPVTGAPGEVGEGGVDEVWVGDPESWVEGVEGADVGCCAPGTAGFCCEVWDSGVEGVSPASVPRRSELTGGVRVLPVVDCWSPGEAFAVDGLSGVVVPAGRLGELSSEAVDDCSVGWPFEVVGPLWLPGPSV